MRLIPAGLMIAVFAGCGGGDSVFDASGGGAADAGRLDANQGPDLDASTVDAAPGTPDAAPPGAPDSGPTAPPDAGLDAEHAHILIDNFCNVSVDPPSYSVPAGGTLQITWHNHSVDYDADVWLSYGGGYLGLVTGGIWADMFPFCSGPGPYDAYADVSIAGGGSSACPTFRVWIHCL